MLGFQRRGVLHVTPLGAVFFVQTFDELRPTLRERFIDYLIEMAA
jgi:hypothetical protein